MFQRMFPILVVCSFGLLAPALADEPVSRTIPAASFVSKPIGFAESNGWCLAVNGQIATAVDFATNAACTIIAVARGDKAADEWPILIVRVDDQQIFRTPVSSTNWSSYTFAHAFAPGIHEIAFAFENDFCQPPEDRNLHVASLTIIPSAEAEGRFTVVDEPGYEQFRKAQTEKWTAGAEEQIRKIRRGSLAVWVTEPDDKPATNVTVSMRQTRHQFSFGTALCTQMFEPEASRHDVVLFQSYVTNYFNSAVTENALKWPNLEPQQNTLLCDTLDRMSSWCASNGIALRGHCLFWGAEYPAWVKDLSDGDLLAAIDRRARSVPERYKDTIDEYDVVNEPLHATYFTDRLGTAVVTRMFGAAAEANPAAKLYINDYGILEGNDSERYVQFIKQLRSDGTLIGGIGVQAHFENEPDPARLSRKLNEFAELKLPVKITEFDCSASNEEVQARCLETVYRAAFASPAVEGILMWGFWEKCHWRPNAALLRSDFSKKPSALKYEQLVFSNWWTHTNGSVDALGRFTAPAFFGDYQIEVRASDGRSTNATVSFSREQGSTTVNLHLPPRPVTGPPPTNQPAATVKSAEGGKSNLAGSQLPKTTPEKSDAAEPVPMTKEKSKAAEQFENDLDRYR